MDELMVLNCRYEISKFPKPAECTTAVVLPEASAHGGTYLIKNWDYKQAVMDNIVILHIEQKDGTRILGLAEAGQMLREGFNSHGIGLCNNMNPVGAGQLGDRRTSHVPAARGAGLR